MVLRDLAREAGSRTRPQNCAFTGVRNECLAQSNMECGCTCIVSSPGGKKSVSGKAKVIARRNVQGMDWYNSGSYHGSVTRYDVSAILGCAKRRQRRNSGQDPLSRPSVRDYKCWVIPPVCKKILMTKINFTRLTHNIPYGKNSGVSSWIPGR